MGCRTRMVSRMQTPWILEWFHRYHTNPAYNICNPKLDTVLSSLSKEQWVKSWHREVNLSWHPQSILFLIASNAVYEDRRLLSCWSMSRFITEPKILISGKEFFFLDEETKLYKVAPDGWNDQHRKKMSIINFTLFLRIKFFVNHFNVIQ